jgi:hypothetical protein
VIKEKQPPCDPSKSDYIMSTKTSAEHHIYQESDQEKKPTLLQKLKADT